MKFTRSKDQGFGSSWMLRWGWLTGRLDPVQGSLAPANHVVAPASSRLTGRILESALWSATRFSLWLGRGDNSMIVAGIVLMPLFVIVSIGLVGVRHV